ncbi:gamma-glutamyl:cysteine ligase YbdK (ATP-grasp superfamily) [Rhodothalassium salexigens DSM 2132]|uniref:Gamma-glutamyl:cysteine ligase YbdK (ATP-grasp superfamily) n=1 Tax=Rhodothalassium salexigens DSM 2132 TaxID=1188247 RepID=A0A4R2PDN0_RHOSA|nr:glutamate-cysteine ligase family protein [Rhodothalassium salexigens]MBB4212291.1 gamma-glutamyl:cysteine ligase YbdK (ATP-grasp superfamily) [Rhodothalassium salexigens DSM 2132]MBK1638351.1 glutamate--cysteine ligase [Rhodothalassium salexigens DSM 2132]TCP32558.1 gamma-glutamyl:cysteine ligase YbdK (ATP-grasp superfamily) [Rhodothalassium salexigens DSM 2132]
MGDEVETSDFRRADFRAFEKTLRFETDLLYRWLKAGRVARDRMRVGAELEAWLVDAQGRPAARNKAFLDAMDDPLVVPELSKFNIEFNTPPAVLAGRVLSRMERALGESWARGRRVARDLGLDLAMIGILPTVTARDLCPQNLSRMTRYRALNEQIMRLRRDVPIHLDIEGEDSLHSVHTDIMLEAATTSFQIHLQVAPGKDARAYNASKVASAPMVAVAANSPFLFGRSLWAETRIPLFEQAVSVGKWDYMERVTFGIRYLEEGFYEVFKANRQRYPVILPIRFDAPPERLKHLRLHNGTIWRWTRALVGFEDDDLPHLRLEQRVVPSGPTVVDCIANAAFYYGLMHYLVERETTLEDDLPFYVARDNFYNAARHGLDASFEWREEEIAPIHRFLAHRFIPMAEAGLAMLGIDDGDIARYIGIIRGRVETGQTGAVWQRAYVAAHGASMADLTLAYLRRQNSGVPVHEWSV